MTPELDLERRWRALVELLAENADLLADRGHGAGVPSWCHARGWSGFLQSLSEAEVEACERNGLPQELPSMRSSGSAPAALQRFAAAVHAATALPVLDAPPAGLSPVLTGASTRKRAQVAAFTAAAAHLAQGARRIVDVGSGHGHLTRHLVAAFRLQGIGLEREAERVAVASALWEKERREGEAMAQLEYSAVDVLCAGPRLRSDDLVVGLHACGELGDVLVQAAASVGARIALVSCCLQKLRAPTRQALSSESAPQQERGVLGLSNLSPGEQGVETSLAENLRARRQRFALSLLLQQRGARCALGEEMRGINRRRAHQPFAQLAKLALERRGLAMATPTELADVEAEAAARFALWRRCSLPRSALARVIETYVLADRARFLVAAGYRVEIGVVFEASVSPRNLMLRARRE